MPEVILLCPACGSTNVYVRGSSNAQVTCRSCGMEGPEFCGPNEVIAAWDALPRALTWTHEPPKVAGWYHWRSGKGQYVTMIQIHEYIRAVFFGETCAPEEKVIGYWDQNGTFRTDLDRGEWAGPITLPVEKQCKS